MAIISIISKILSIVFSIVYKVLQFLHLTPTLFLVLAGVVVEIAFGVILSNRTGFVIFHVILLISLIYAFLATFSLIPDFGKKSKKSGKNKGNMEIIEPKTVQPIKSDTESVKAGEFNYERNFTFSEVKKSKIRFYKVSKNPDYVFAEEGARCYLYKIDGERIVFIKSEEAGA